MEKLIAIVSTMKYHLQVARCQLIRFMTIVSYYITSAMQGICGASLSDVAVIP